ncbi:MAG TPA: FHA domain-containing protein [Kofleriaceae bacterium]|nr:FHA domain-containing protein [Kofleriaceae bacterium]
MIATCSDVTAEQIQGKQLADASACLIDQWGNPHALSDRSMVGRLQSECTVTILHHSVSAIHAQIERVAGPSPGRGAEVSSWRVVDRGSLNGTFVEDEQVRSAPLHDGERVRFGNVSFFFSSQLIPLVRHEPGAGYTVPVRSRDIAFHAKVADGAGVELALVQRAAGGIVRIDDDTALEFARLEFALLKILAERRLQHSDPELAFVSSQELAELLDFKSQDADGENVRELVRRVRRKFKSEGIADLIESRQGVGYRLAWSVRE